MLTQSLLRFALLGEEWILYVLALLSLASVTVIIERLAYYSTRGTADFDALAASLLRGNLKEARNALEGARGMEGEVLRAAIDEAQRGPEAVQDVIQSAIVRQRGQYERRLSFLGTLGNNAPFVGLLGTVLGIIRAFQDLSNAPLGQAAQGPQAVMAGISSALVATAVGIFVALPAVVAFNGFQRWLKTVTGRTNTLGLALLAHLRTRAEKV